MTHPVPAREAPNAPTTGMIGIILLARTTLNSSIRIVYPFLPAISRGLGVSLTAVGFLLTVRSFVGLSSPLFGSMSDRAGRRAMMLSALAILVSAATLISLSSVQTRFSAYSGALLAFALFGIAKVVYDPALQAYLGDVIPYHQRGRIWGIVEMSWSAAWLLGVPAAGFLIEFDGWRAPFIAIGVLGLFSFLLTRRLPKAHDGHAGTRHLQWHALLGNRSALSALVVSLLMSFAHENVFVVYGAWMESAFGLSISALGLASIVIGVSEIVAEGSVAAFVDRIGKKRAVAVGLVLTSTAYGVLPAVSQSLTVALIALAAVFIAFEFTIVASLPLVSELAPATRGTLMALNVAAMSAGRMVGALIATPLWLYGGITLNGVVSAGATFVGALVLVGLIQEGG